MLAALRAAARGEPGPGGDAAVAQAARAVASALPRAAERAVLVRLVDALADEWRESFRSAEIATAGERAQRTHHLQDTWEAQIEPALTLYLRGMGLASGTVLVSPALGPEGRITLEGPAGPVVAVGFLPDAPLGVAPLFSAVRELSFPLVRRVTALLDAAVDRVGAERTSAAAAVRAGALILAASSATLAEDYRLTFLNFCTAAGDRAAADSNAFARSYPLAAGLERALTAELTRLMHDRPGR